jgi:general secretion pathway protein M
MTELSLGVRRIAAVGLLFAAVAGPMVGIVMPMLDAYRDAQQQLDQVRVLLRHAEAAAGKREGLKATLAKLKQSSDADGGFLNGANDSLAAAQIQSRLKTVLDSAQGELKSTQILPGKKEGNLTRVGVRVQMAGSIGAAQRVLHAIESGTPFLFTENVEIRTRPSVRSAGPRRDEGTLDMRFDAYGFIRGAAS